MTPLYLTPMQTDDGPAMEALLHRAFGRARKSLPAYRLRQGSALSHLSWVARSPDGQVLGCLRFWQVTLQSTVQRDAPALKCALLGPLAVDLGVRGGGVAGKLILSSLARAADLGFDLCFVVGEPRMYRRFGFTSAAWSGIGAPPEISVQRLQVRELRLGALSAIAAPQTLAPYARERP